MIINLGMAKIMEKTQAHQSPSYNSSKFHWLFLRDMDTKRPSHDTPILETQNYVVLPSLGSIVPGWLLVVPKFPVSRIADIEPETRKEFEDLVLKARNVVEKRYNNNVYLFEHGGYRGSPISCGVDQAHLHIVPLPFDLLSVAKCARKDEWISSEQEKMPYEFCGEEEYLYTSSKEGTLYGAVPKPESQWFRKLIASHIGCPEMWDYKKHSFSQNIKETIKVIKMHG